MKLVYFILKSIICKYFYDVIISLSFFVCILKINYIVKIYNLFIYLLLQYAQETQHEKILRGLALGISLTMYGRLEEADTLIESLCRDKDPLLRRSGMHTVAMAYCGTGNNKAIRKLLHIAVSICCIKGRNYA